VLYNTWFQKGTFQRKHFRLILRSCDISYLCRTFQKRHELKLPVSSPTNVHLQLLSSISLP
jgi:hypothetical protein